MLKLENGILLPQKPLVAALLSDHIVKLFTLALMTLNLLGEAVVLGALISYNCKNV